MKGKKWNRKIMAIALVTITFSFTLIGVQIKKQKEEIVLDFGMFVGSNWDVENANSYVIIDKAIKRFEKEHKGVKIKYDSGIRKEDYSEWLARKTLVGETPDVFMILSDDFYKYASLEALESLEQLGVNDKEFYFEEYYKTALETGTYEDIQYALPFETVPTLMFVNKTLLQKEGFEVPNLNWKWANLHEISREITKDLDGDGSLDQFGTYNYSWKESVYCNGASLFDEGGKISNFTNERVVSAVKFTKTLHDLNQGQKVTQDDFDSGKVAFMPLSFAEYRTYKTYPYKMKKYTSFQWDCIPLPAGPSGENISEVNTLLMSISKQTKHKKLAWEFLKLLTYDEEIQKGIFRYSQGASVLKKVTDSGTAEAMLRQDMEVGEKVIDRAVLSGVIEQGFITPRFQKYDETMVLAEVQITQMLEEEKNISSSMKILQRNVSHFLKQ